MQAPTIFAIALFLWSCSCSRARPPDVVSFVDCDGDAAHRDTTDCPDALRGYFRQNPTRRISGIGGYYEMDLTAHTGTNALSVWTTSDPRFPEAKDLQIEALPCADIGGGPQCIATLSDDLEKMPGRIRMFTVVLFGVHRQQRERIDTSLMMVSARDDRSAQAPSISYSGRDHPRVEEVPCIVTRDQARRAASKGRQFGQSTEDTQDVPGDGPLFCVTALERFLREHPRSRIADVIAVERVAHPGERDTVGLNELGLPGTATVLVVTADGEAFPEARDLKVYDTTCGSDDGCRHEETHYFESSARFRVPYGETVPEHRERSRTVGYLLFVCKEAAKGAR